MADTFLEMGFQQPVGYEWDHCFGSVCILGGTGNKEVMKDVLLSTAPLPDNSRSPVFNCHRQIGKIQFLMYTAAGQLLTCSTCDT